MQRKLTGRLSSKISGGGGVNLKDAIDEVWEEEALKGPYEKSNSRGKNQQKALDVSDSPKESIDLDAPKKAPNTSFKVSFSFKIR